MASRTRFVLPSGAEVRLVAAGGELITDDRVDGDRVFEGRMLSALRSGALRIERRDGGWAALDERAIMDLALPDYHALRDAAYRLGVIGADGEPGPMLCENCDAPLPEGDPRTDRDFEDWYAPRKGAAPDERPRKLAEKIALGDRASADTIAVATVRVRDAMPLWRAVAADGSFRVTAAIVRAMGVRALGPTTDVRRIARALAGASDHAWASVELAFLAAQYAPRAYTPVPCEACGTVNELPMPETTELTGLLPEDAAEAHDAEFPTLAEFAARVERIRAEVYRARGVRDLPLVVDGGAPYVDVSGTPVWGTYTPMSRGAGLVADGAAITLYYRTFAKEWAAGRYDVDAEIRETVDHECEHHLYDLEGHDPKDEEERAEADVLVRERFGERAVRRARAASVVRELGAMAGIAVVGAVLIAVVYAVLVGAGILP